MELFNNSESPFDLRAGSTWITVFPGKSQLFAYRDGVTIRVGDGRKLHFDRVDPPKEFTKKGLLSVALKAQMDSQFRIWLVMPATKWPALEPPQQPAGFPLTARQ